MKRTENTMAAKFRWHLKELREQKNLDRVDLLYRTRLSYNTLYLLERKPVTSRIDAHVVLSLMEALGVTMSELVTPFNDDTDGPN